MMTSHILQLQALDNATHVASRDPWQTPGHATTKALLQFKPETITTLPGGHAQLPAPEAFGAPVSQTWSLDRSWTINHWQVCYDFAEQTGDTTQHGVYGHLKGERWLLPTRPAEVHHMKQ